MKPKLYLETTIPSYLKAWPSRDLIVAGHQQITQEWWRTRRTSFDICVSQFVLDEAGAGDPQAAQERLEVLRPFPLLDINDDVLRLAAALLKANVLPEKAARDAGHIAVSAVHGLDYLMSWNCAHIANAMISKSVQKVCQQSGFVCPVICTPEELMEG